MKILFTGGGTAGHIFPIISLAREIRRNYSARYGTEKGLQFLYIGPKDEFGERLLSQEGIEVKIISSGKIRRYLDFKSFFQNLFDILFNIPIGYFQAFYHIFLFSPDLIFTKGGYGSLPVILANWFFLVPVFLHESDISPGLANKIASRFCAEIFTSFPIEKTEYFPSNKMIWTGNLIREEILEGSIEKAQELFKLTNEKPVILVLGGSQGSQRINDVLMTILPEFLKSFELIHQTGIKNFKEIEAEAKVICPKELQKYYHPLPFLEENELKHAYAAAFLIVGRAGAGTIFEIAAVGKPSILIPLPEAAQNHQVKNAYFYAQTGACLVLEEANFTPHFFLETLKNLFSKPEKLLAMEEAAKNFAKPRAAKIIAEYIVSYLSRK